MTPWLLLGLGFLLIAGNAVFVAAETALVMVDRPEVELAAAGGDASAARVAKALKQLSTQLSGAQLGITVTSLAIGLVAEPSAARLLNGPLTATGLPDGAVEPVAIALALVLAAVAQMVLGELVPKNLALALPLTTARRVIALQVGFSLLARPVIRVLNGTANAILRAMGVEPIEELRSARTPDELSLLVQQSAHSGSLSAGTAQLLVRSLSFGDKQATDVMTPRVQVQFLNADDTVADLIAATRLSGHSRFPVLGDGADDVVGLVHVKHGVSVPVERRSTVRVRDVMLAPVVVPAVLELDPLLDVLRQRGLQMAVVLDEFGGTDGIVTFEDLVEELVGEVVDERDRRPEGIRQRKDGTFLLSGLLRPDEVTAQTGVPMPEGDYETVAGLVLDRLRRMPKVRDVVDVDGAQLRVQRMDRRRIDRIVLVPRDVEATEDET